MKVNPTQEERAEARLATQAAKAPNFAPIERAPRKLALGYSFNAIDRNDPALNGLYKLYGSAQPVAGGAVTQIDWRDMTLADLPGIAKLVRGCTVPFGQLVVTGDFGGSLVFPVPAKSKDADVAEVYAILGDEIAVQFSAVGAILTYKSLDRRPVAGRPGLSQAVPATDAHGNKLGRLGSVAPVAALVGSSARAPLSMAAMLAAAPSAVEFDIEATPDESPV